jgi:hypothetical protein
MRFSSDFSMPADFGAAGFGSPFIAFLNALSQPFRLRMELRVVEVAISVTLSSSTSCGVERMRKMSEQLCIVVEQLIWPPRKKTTLPSALNSGAGKRGQSVVYGSGEAEVDAYILLI